MLGHVLNPITIGITHTGSGALELARQLQAAGLHTVNIPVIEFGPPSEPELARQTLNTWPAGAWLAITSPQGARAWHDLCSRPPDTWPVAAVGESTARELTRLGCPVSFQPSRADGRTLGRELPARSGQGVLHLTSDQAADDLKAELDLRGVPYQRLTAYRTVPRHLSEQDRENLNACTVLTVASGTAARALSGLVRLQMPLVVMGRQTAHTARALGFTHIIQAPSPSLDALTEAVLQFSSGVEQPGS